MLEVLPFAVALSLSLSTIVLVLATLPLQVRLLYVMVFKTRDDTIEEAYHVALINGIITDIIFALIFLIIQEPASYGLARPVYEALIGPIPIIVSAQVFVVNPLGRFFHFAISINRLTAVVDPRQHIRIWHRVPVTKLALASWAIAFVLCIPLLFPRVTKSTVFSIVSPLHGIGHIYQPDDRTPTRYYELTSTITAGIMEASMILIYLVIAKIVRNKAMSEIARRLTVASVIMCIGGFAIFSLVVSEYIAQFAFNSGISAATFWALFKAFNALSCCMTTWTLILMFPSTRRRTFGFLSCPQRKQKDGQPVPIAITSSGSGSRT